MVGNLTVVEMAKTITNNCNNETSIDIAKELVKYFEGLALKPYICTGGKRTIGYGHVMKDNEAIEPPITKILAEQLLQQDLLKTQAIVRKYCPVPLLQTQEAALISFVFNCGSGAFQASALRQKLLRREYDLAADEFLKWVYAKGLKLKGLIKRRLIERNLFLSGS